MAVTGLLSYAAYDPRLPGNDETPGAGLLRFYLFSWPTGPAWLYRVNQGVHVTLGVALVPVVLAKLWSVLPRLFSWPPVRSPAQLLERISLIMVVGGVLFEFATGIMDIQNFYVFPFSFYTAHLYGAWVFIAGLVIHVILKFPRMLAGLRSRSLTPGAADPAGADPARGAGPGWPAGRSPSPADHLAARAAGRGRRRLRLAGRADGRPVDRRLDAADRAVRAPRPVRRPARHAPGEPDGGRHRPDRRRRRLRLPAGPGRRPAGVPDPRPGSRAAAALRRAADRLRRGLVRVGHLVRGAAGRPGPAGRRQRTRPARGSSRSSAGARSRPRACPGPR